MKENLDIIYDILGFNFNPEREEILTNFKESFQVQACPGSGKTTLLVAKLMLLAQDVDFSKGAVCILTHTNVAIDEIKEKIKKYNKPGYESFISNVNKLFKYPNFVGTTQSFLDKYLGIPGYIDKYGYRPNKIDDDIVLSFSIKEFFGFEKGTKYYLNSRTYDNNIGIEKVFDTSFDVNLNKLILSQKFGKKAFGETSKTYKLLLSIKIDQIKNHRLLKFNEINYFSLYYLNKTKKIKSLLQKRFKYIFIDEIQDTNGLHKEILNKLFEGGKNIIQGFGDYNQEILEDGSGGDFTIFGGGEIKPINDSMRLSPVIANNVMNVCINPQKLKGYGEVEIPIYFIIFDNDRIGEVVNSFIDKIKEYKLQESSKKVSFKAVGYVHKENGDDKLSVGSYWTDYNNGSIKKNKGTLFSYFQKVEDKEFKLKGFKIYKDNFLDGLIHTFNHDKDNQIKQSNGRSFSKVSLVKYFKDYDLYDNFSLNVLKWSKQINKGVLDWESVKEYVLSLEINNKKLKDSNFLDNKYAIPLSIGMIKNDNILVKDDIKVTFSTIHKVKGETHTGTLLLDTNFRNQNTSKILEFWDNNTEKEGGKSLDKKGLKIHYVGLTRATHLLCIAIKKDNLKLKEQKILKELTDTNKDIELIELLNI